MNFKKKVKLLTSSFSIREKDPVVLDSCIWYIEAALNYTYADLTCENSLLYFDSAFISIDVDEGYVKWSDAVSGYNNFKDTLSTQYGELAFQNKQFQVADIFVVDVTEQEATLCMLSAFIGGGPINLLSFDPEIDFWKYGGSYCGNGGYCGGPYINTHLDSDAAEQIEMKVRYRQSAQNGRYYADNGVTIYFDVFFVENTSSGYHYECDLTNPNDAVPEDNYFDRLHFVNDNSLSNFHSCLEPIDSNEMNFYLDKMEYIIYTKFYQCIDDIEDLDFISINLIGDDMLIGNYLIYLHRGWVTYGEQLFTGTQPEEL